MPEGVGNNVLAALGSLFKKTQVPSFKVYNWLDKRYVMLLLMKVTEIQESDFQATKLKYLNGVNSTYDNSCSC